MALRAPVIISRQSALQMARKHLRLAEIRELLETLPSEYSSEDDDPNDLQGLEYIPEDDQNLIPVIGGGHDRGALGGSPVHTDLEGDSDRDSPAANNGETTDDDATVDPLLQGTRPYPHFLA